MVLWNGRYMECGGDIFDFRFLLILFVILSLGNTIWCIFASPHFPDEEEEDDDIPHALKGWNLQTWSVLLGI